MEEETISRSGGNNRDNWQQMEGIEKGKTEGCKHWNPTCLAQTKEVQDLSPRFATCQDTCRDRLMQSTGS